MSWIPAASTLAVLLGVSWLAGVYNQLVRARNACEESWADIETELRRRYDLVPNLVGTVRGYAVHERSVLKLFCEARAAAGVHHDSPVVQAREALDLDSKVQQLFALAERYPELKTSARFQELHDLLTDSEDRIQRARRFYNANVRELVNCIESFPSSLVAHVFGFQEREYFAVSADDAAVPSEVRFRGG